jgi:MinD-like ATPase involved in chromosome partitioning or flagellar assembly
VIFLLVILGSTLGFIPLYFIDKQYIASTKIIVNQKEYPTTINQDSQGLSSLLSNRSELKDSTIVTDIKNLSLIPSGPLLANPPEALGSKRMLAILDELKML